MMTYDRKYEDAERFAKMPDCTWRMVGGLRAYVHTDKDGHTENILEALYEDGWGRPFWGPLPQFRVDDRPTAKPKKKFWNLFQKAHLPNKSFSAP